MSKFRATDGRLVEAVLVDELLRATDHELRAFPLWVQMALRHGWLKRPFGKDYIAIDKLGEHLVARRGEWILHGAPGEFDTCTQAHFLTHYEEMGH